MKRWPAETGLIAVLLLLGAAFSIATLSEQKLEGAAAGEAVAREVVDVAGSNPIVIIAGPGRDDRAFAESVEQTLQKHSRPLNFKTLSGHPSEIKLALSKLTPAVLVMSPSARRWSMWEKSELRIPVYSPQSRYWPRFLTRDNLLNVANQVAVMAILAAGMTLILITGHVDLSVGSLIALSAVTATLLIRRYAGAEQAGTGGMVLCSIAAILLCGLIGAASGALAVRFALPSFLITLGVMKMTRGLAFKVSDGESVYQIPDAFVWLGRGADLFGIPNAVVLMAVLYLAVHVVLTRTTFGRYVYAVGGNTEAARLAGVRVRSIVVWVFALNGLLAGLGGIVLASQLKSGSPTFGVEYELYVIAAVVVGGTSLTGGQGNVVGTLLGAFLLAVIQNGMNLTGVDSYDQQIVLGAIIIAALVIDRFKTRKA